MFKLVVLSVLVAVAVAKPSSPFLASLVGEKTIESHGNSVVHASAPVLAHAAPAALVSSPVIAETPLTYAAPAAVVQEKTIESHGNSVVHASAPVFAAAPIAHHPAPLLYTSYAVPAAPLVAEKTITSYGHSVVHHGGPAIAHTAYLAPTLAIL